MGNYDNSYGNSQRLNPMRTGSTQRTVGNTSLGRTGSGTRTDLSRTGSDTRTDLGHTGATHTELDRTGSSRPADADSTLSTVSEPQVRSANYQTPSYDTPSYDAAPYADASYDGTGYGNAGYDSTSYGDGFQDPHQAPGYQDARYDDFEDFGGKPAEVPQYTRTPYVRKPRPRKTQEAIDDLAEDNTPSATYAHDSNVAVGGSTPLAGRPYSRSRSNMGKLQRDLHYGQYLEIPKGKRQIFASRQRSQQIRARVVMGIIIVVLILVAVFAFSLLANNA